MSLNNQYQNIIYPDSERSSRPTGCLNSAGVAAMRKDSFFNFLREYDNQMRDNFTKEALLLAFIAALSIWPVIHAVQAMATRWRCAENFLPR
jgi:hypothetical protein